MKPKASFQWRLTLSYTVVTSIALLAVTFLVTVIDYYRAAGSFVPARDIPEVFRDDLGALVPLLTDGNAEAIDGWTGRAFRRGSLDIGDISRYGPSLVIHVVAVSVFDGDDRLVARTVDPFFDDFDPSITATDDGIVELVVPIEADSETVGSVLFTFVDPWDGGLAAWLPTFLDSLVQSLILSAIFGAAFGYVVSRNLVKRLRTIRRVGTDWARGQLRERIHDGVGDEITDLAESFNDMASRIEVLVESNKEIAALEEQRRMARELHDTVKQQLFSVNMHLASLKLSLPHDVDQARVITDEALKVHRQAQSELQGLIVAFRRSDELGLGEAIRNYVHDWEGRTGLRVAISISGELPESASLSHSLFRVAQEALNNIERHAEAGSVEFELRWEETCIAMTIRDDGNGFDPAGEERGHGLVGMEERLAEHGGNLAIDSCPGEGTVLSITIPRELA